MKTTDELLSALKARLMGIHLRALEEQRALDALKQALAALSGQAAPRILWRWSSASGLLKSVLTQDEQDQPLQTPCELDQALDLFKKSNENVVLALLDPWRELGDAFFQRALREALAHARGSGKAIVLVGREWPVPQELRSDLFLCDLPLPTRGELEDYIWSLAKVYEEKLADRVKIEASCIPDLARACQGLTLDEARSIVALSLVRFKGIGPESISMAIREKKQIVARGGLLEFEEADRGLNDVGGLEQFKDWIGKRSRLFSDQARQAGIQAPKGLVLLGVPGTGKTLAARAVASAWSLPLVRFDAGRLFGSLVGESEGNLRQALKTAEAVSPCVLMVDEIEKAFSQNGGLDGGTSSRVFGGLLSWLQDKQSDVFVVATANDVSRLPPEMLRKDRIDGIFFVDLPDFRSRSEILGIHLRRVGHRWKTADLEESAKSSQGFTGSELEAAVQAALIEAFHSNRKPGPADLLKAIRSAVPLSKTMGEKIQALREWCKSGRAVPAGRTLEQDASRKEVSVDV